ncbi:MAG: TetR/AcrR family transcriptional regulator [Rhodospirillales bacterium]|nr:TetR/AcrR family transcriptional regulator [Rhodospirillales bacterium]
MSRQRPVPRRAKPVRPGEQLRADDWIDHANELLINENIRGVRIATLCQRLGVTKGSFYWHFRSRRDLLDALLQAWRKKNTMNVMNRVVSFVTPLRSIRAVLSLPRRPPPSGARAWQMSVRDWARRDRNTFRSLQEIDVIRLRAFEQLFRRQGFAAKEAKSRAYIAYTIMMGDSILKDTIGDEVDTDTFLASALSLLTSARTGSDAASGVPDDREAKETPALQ